MNFFYRVESYNEYGKIITYIKTTAPIEKGHVLDLRIDKNFSSYNYKVKDIVHQVCHKTISKLFSTKTIEDHTVTIIAVPIDSEGVTLIRSKEQRECPKLSPESGEA